MIQKLGALVTRIQRIRETIPIEMKRGDARHVALSGIQTSITPQILTFSALEFVHQNRPEMKLSELCGLKFQTDEELLSYFSTWIKLNILIFSQFKFEGLFSDLLAAFDEKYNQKKGFQQKVVDLLDRLSISDKKNKADCFMVMALLRNSLHNNGINKNGNHDINVSGVRFIFEDDKPTRATTNDIVFIVEQGIEIVAGLINLPEILGLPAPIENRFQIEMGQFG
jgi:hypothetical protein